MRTLLLPVFAFSCLLFSCSRNVSKVSVADSTAAPVVKTDTLSDWHSLTESWSASLNLKNGALMRSFYADTVLHYGDKISADEVVQRQQSYFNTHPDYRQKITEYLGEEQLQDGSWRIRITKQVTAGGKRADYPSSLIFAKQKGIWKIVSESDDITDLRKGQAISLHYDETVTIIGLLEENTGFEKNTSGGDAKSDNRKNYYVIWPESYLDISSTGKQAKKFPAQRNVDRLEIEGDENVIRPLLNKGVHLTGTLHPADSAHPFTRVFVQAEKIVH